MSELSPFVVIVGMLNGMIGGVILVLPLLVLESGSIGSGLIILISGIFSYYSCMLCVKHLGSYSDLDQAIMHHFDNNKAIKIFYDLIVFLNLALLLLLYFELIVQQWEGILGESVLNPILNFVVLLLLVAVMKYYQFGVSLLAYGIVSCVGYCIFLCWMLLSAPSGSNKMPTFGPGSITLAASMGQAFSIQTIFIPVLRKNKDETKYQNYTLITFVWGFSIYMYIGYMGAFGVLNRPKVQEHPETIQDYFTKGYWQVICLQIIYLVHLYSVFPEFLLISMKRFFGILPFQLKIEKGTIGIPESIYTFLLLVACLVVSLTRVYIGDIIQINGGVIGFFFIYFFPLITHVKCLYFRKEQRPIQIQVAQISSSSQNMRISLLTTSSQPTKQQQNSEYKKKQLKCQAKKPELIGMILDITMLIGMLASGFFIMYEAIHNVFVGDNQN